MEEKKTSQKLLNHLESIGQLWITLETFGQLWTRAQDSIRGARNSHGYFGAGGGT
jgi:hypothetical protein